MNERHAMRIQELIDAVLTCPGDSDSQLRHTVEARAASLAGGLREISDGMPTELETYVEKVARHAYRVTDEDIETLKKKGYSEDALFEITLSAALGAGVGRLERGLGALKGNLQ